MNLNMIKRLEFVPRSELMGKVDKHKRNVRTPHVPSVKVSHMEHHDGKHSEIPATHEGQTRPKEYPTQRIRDRTTNELRGTSKTVWVSIAFSR